MVLSWWNSLPQAYSQEAQSASSLPPAFLLKRQLPLILTDDQKQAISSHSTSPSSQQRLVKPSTQDTGLLVHTWFSASRLPPSTEATTHTKLFQAMKTTHSVYLLCSLFKKEKKKARPDEFMENGKSQYQRTQHPKHYTTFKI